VQSWQGWAIGRAGRKDYNCDNTAASIAMTVALLFENVAAWGTALWNFVKIARSPNACRWRSRWTLAPRPVHDRLALAAPAARRICNPAFGSEIVRGQSDVMEV
jgi:hypothetical protein